MERMTTLNEDKGKQISDLEALLITMNKLLDDKLEHKPKAGITLAKGKRNERKFRYSEAKEVLRQMESYFGIKGCISLGICDTCNQFDQRAHGNKAFGNCKRNGNTCHRWDSCPNHSKNGGGYGI